MNLIWSIFGKLVYIFGWPVLHFYLKNTNRTRILVIVGDEVLVVKGWLGSGKWSLPGGGVNKGESIADGAVRELFEETGISIHSNELNKLSNFPKKSHGTEYFIHGFYVDFKSKPEINRQKAEIIGTSWVNWQELQKDNRTKPYIKRLLEERFL